MQMKREGPVKKDTTMLGAPDSTTKPLLLCNPPVHFAVFQNVSPVSYSEVPEKKGETENLRKEKIVIAPGSEVEVYTEEHEKLLDNTEKSWTLFVDGCGKDGKRIYDSIQAPMQAKMVNVRMNTVDVAAEVKCLRRSTGMRCSNVYDLSPMKFVFATS